MSPLLAVHASILEATFVTFRNCGRGQRECQVLWVSPWTAPLAVARLVHPIHRSHAGGFEVDTNWITTFWLSLAEQRDGVRAQVHTHPRSAFHSASDDAWPIVHTPGFLSLVIPNFARGDVTLADAYLAHLEEDGQWTSLDPSEHIEVIR